MTTYVLVPGAWLGGWVWKKIIPRLEERRHSVYPVTLTGMGERLHLASKDHGIETAIEDVLNVIKYNDLNDLVLVGHSFAGKVVAGVADRASKNVKMILYMDAYRPEKKFRKPQGSFNPSEFGVFEGMSIPFAEQILDMIGKDVQGADREWMLSKGTPWPKKLVTDPVTLSENFDSIKNAYIFCTGGGDNVEEILKEKLVGPYKVIESGHYPMVTKPDELVEAMVALSGNSAPLPQ